MIFYKVNNPNDSQVINPKSNWIFIHNELYTEKEFDKLNIPNVINYYDSLYCQHKTIAKKDLFEKVEISKFNTYWFFGARFKKGEFIQ